MYSGPHADPSQNLISFHPSIKFHVNRSTTLIHNFLSNLDGRIQDFRKEGAGSRATMGNRVQWSNYFNFSESPYKTFPYPSLFFSQPLPSPFSPFPPLPSSSLPPVPSPLFSFPTFPPLLGEGAPPPNTARRPIAACFPSPAGLGSAVSYPAGPGAARPPTAIFWFYDQMQICDIFSKGIWSV